MSKPIGCWKQLQERASSNLLIVLAMSFATSGCIAPLSLDDDERTALRTWPADGSQSVPRNLPVVSLLSAAQLASAPRLFDDRQGCKAGRPGTPVGCSSVAVAVDSARWNSCYRWVLPELLRPGTRYRFAVGACSPEEPQQGPSFQTAATEDLTAPAPLPFECHDDEESAPFGCLLRQSQQVRGRFAFSEAVQGWWLEPVQKLVEAPRGLGSLRFPLPPRTPQETRVMWLDLAGNVTIHSLRIARLPGTATVSLHEARANPAGREPAQEFLELFNPGPHPVELAGMFLSDSYQETGDPIEAPFLLPSGGFVLLVGDGFQAESTLDQSVPPGTPLLRLGRALTPGGLRNAGEPIILRDAQGHRVSEIPAFPSPQGGSCVARREGAHFEAASQEAFFLTAPGGCTPGLPNEPEKFN